MPQRRAPSFRSAAWWGAALLLLLPRLAHLRGLSQLGEGLLRALVSGQAIEPTPFLRSMRDKAT